MTPSPAISQIVLYPIKSCGGVAVPQAFAGPRGLEAEGIGDRRWVVSDGDGAMITQRQDPALARVSVALEPGALRLTGDGLEPLRIDPAETGEERASVLLFGREAVGHRAPASVDDWFSRFLGRPARVLYQTDEDLRLCDLDFAVAPGSDRVGYADAYPCLIVGEATLARINSLLEEAVPMNRFRPNIVVAGSPADAEYGWKRLALGEAELTIVKPCARCVMTTIDQERGVTTGKEPLATLGRAYFLSARFGERQVQGAIFGENAIPTRTGLLRLGDPVTILERKPHHAFRDEEASASLTG